MAPAASRQWHLAAPARADDDRDMNGDPRSAKGAVGYELTAWECLEKLRGEFVGRLCIIDHGYPVAFPISYRVDGSDDDARIVMRASPATTIGSYEGLASLEVDDIDLDAGRAWSVIVRGHLRPLLGAPGVDPQPLLTVNRTRWLELPIAAISGRRFVADRPGAGFTVEWQSAPVEPEQ